MSVHFVQIVVKLCTHMTPMCECNACGADRTADLCRTAFHFEGLSVNVSSELVPTESLVYAVMSAAISGIYVGLV